MMEIWISDKVPWEYFCKGCFQLRLSLIGETPKLCKNCGSDEIIIAAPGTLDKEDLKKRYRRLAHEIANK